MKFTPWQFDVYSLYQNPIKAHHQSIPWRSTSHHSTSNHRLPSTQQEWSQNSSRRSARSSDASFCVKKSTGNAHPLLLTRKPRSKISRTGFRPLPLWKWQGRILCQRDKGLLHGRDVAYLQHRRSLEKNWSRRVPGNPLQVIELLRSQTLWSLKQSMFLSIHRMSESCEA